MEASTKGGLIQGLGTFTMIPFTPKNFKGLKQHLYLNTCESQITYLGSLKPLKRLTYGF